jgi:hypothetical protein
MNNNQPVDRNERLFLVSSSNGWYLETPDDQAQTDSQRQTHLLRVFSDSASAERYLSAVAPFADYHRRLVVELTSLNEIIPKGFLISSKLFTRTGAPLVVEHCTIGYREWPVSKQVVYDFQEKSKQ